MIKRATLVWIVLAAASIGALFAVKYQVQTLEERLTETNRDVLENLKAIHVLKAEWAYLNQPARLEDLGRRLLDMEPMSAEQVVGISDIPLRPAETGDREPAPSDAPPRKAPGAFAPLLAKAKRIR